MRVFLGDSAYLRVDRKQEQRRLLAGAPLDSRLKYVDHVDGAGTALFQQVCKLDLEGIVGEAKVSAMYRRSRKQHRVQDS